MNEKTKNSILKIIPHIFALIGFVLYQLIVNSIDFQGAYRSIGAGIATIVFYGIGFLLKKYL